MASRGGPVAAGSDGSDFGHRERVANQYRIRYIITSFNSLFSFSQNLLFQLPEQSPAEGLPLLPRPALLPHARQAVCWHIRQAGHIHPGAGGAWNPKGWFSIINFIQTFVKNLVYTSHSCGSMPGAAASPLSSMASPPWGRMSAGPCPSSWWEMLFSPYCRSSSPWATTWVISGSLSTLNHLKVSCSGRYINKTFFLKIFHN